MKCAIVTGGTKGIGFAITKILLQNDYFVIANYSNDKKNAEVVQKNLQFEYGDSFRIFKKAMETKPDIEQYIAFLKEEKLLQNGLDAIVLNAGCTDRTCWQDLSWEQWSHVMDVNINAPSAMLRALDSYINRDASILFISSAMSVYPHATSVPYTVSKSAINGLTKALVKEYASRQIRVNAILPGFVETPWQIEKPEDQRNRINEKIALHRFAKPEEIAEMAFATIRSSYINGALLQVDGGYCYR